MLTSTLTRKGQVTIPKKIRDALSLKPNDSVVFVYRNNEIIIKPLHNVFLLRGSVKTNGTYDIYHIRQKTKEEITGKIAHE